MAYICRPNTLVCLHECSILGMLMILAGLYLFLLGKRKELVPESEEKPKDELQFQSEDKIKESPRSNV